MYNHHFKINIAIDGPAGAGKSTVAREVANRLRYVYVDTGAMYRAMTLKVLRHNIDPSHTEHVSNLAAATRIELKTDIHGQHVMLDSEEVTHLLRSQEVNRAVSQVAQIPIVREKLVQMQQVLSQHKGVVMDGRDIGSKVMPDAEVKIYLTASVEERAQRRFDEMLQNDPESKLELSKLKEEIQARDKMDCERESSPLTIADDAVVIDSSSLDIEQVVTRILEICEHKMTAGG